MPSSPGYKRNYKQEWNTEQQRNEKPARAERAAARRSLDAKGVDRSGKDVSHNKSLDKGGTNKDGFKLESRGTNRSRNGHKPGEKL